MADLAMCVGLLSLCPLMFAWNLIFKTGFIPCAPPDIRYDPNKEFYASLTPLVVILWLSWWVMLALVFKP